MQQHKFSKIEEIDDKELIRRVIEKDIHRCMICKKEIEKIPELIVTDINLLDKKNNVIEWKLCSECFGFWTNQEYDKLSEKLKEQNA